MGQIIVFITTGSEEEAAHIAQTLVEKQYAACVNIIRNIRSIYRWEGKVEDDSEVLMIVKTTEPLFPALEAQVKEMHSYSTAEIIAFPITLGSEKYLNWMRQSVVIKEK
jgi:periplasmic divalent cation tolerance protein